MSGKPPWTIPDDVWGDAEFSGDGDHRYVLWRVWEPIPESKTDFGYVVFRGSQPEQGDEDYR